MTRYDLEGEPIKHPDRFGFSSSNILVVPVGGPTMSYFRERRLLEKRRGRAWRKRQRTKQQSWGATLHRWIKLCDAAGI